MRIALETLAVEEAKAAAKEQLAHALNVLSYDPGPIDRFWGLLGFKGDCPARSETLHMFCKGFRVRGSGFRVL